jgi:translation initiation factor 2 gamma subunit (eIF-2gamma)
VSRNDGGGIQKIKTGESLLINVGSHSTGGRACDIKSEQVFFPFLIIIYSSIHYASNLSIQFAQKLMPK